MMIHSHPTRGKLEPPPLPAMCNAPLRLFPSTSSPAHISHPPRLRQPKRVITLPSWHSTCCLPSPSLILVFSCSLSCHRITVGFLPFCERHRKSLPEPSLTNSSTTVSMPLSPSLSLPSYLSFSLSLSLCVCVFVFAPTILGKQVKCKELFPLLVLYFIITFRLFLRFTLCNCLSMCVCVYWCVCVWGPSIYIWEPIHMHLGLVYSSATGIFDGILASP